MLTSPSAGYRDRAARGYGQMHRSALVDGASPHELVRLLFDGAVASVSAAISLDPGLTGDRDARHRAIDRALAFVNELQGALRDPDTDPLSGNLFSLYAFVTTQLLEAGAEADAVKLENARSVLAPLADAWVQIAPHPDAPRATPNVT